ncbi:MAG: hypothetical protein ACXV3F_04160 [Frankiaceae bacterium]
MRWWKVAGLAGVAGVAATGVAVARDQRKRRSYTSEEIRERLHTRFQEQDTSRPDVGTGRSVGAASGQDALPEDVRDDSPRRRWRSWRARRRHKR